MAEIEVVGGEVRVRFTRSEHVWGLVRDLTVPVTAIRSVEVVPDGVRALRGMRVLGLGLPGRAVGRWWTFKVKDLVSVRRRQPAIRLALDDQRFTAVLVGTDDPAPVAAAIEAARSANRSA